LEWAVRKNALCWADSVVAANPDCRVIIATHCYTNSSGKRTGTCAEEHNIIGNCGKTTWNEFVSKHSNICMVVSGHINGSVYSTVTGLNGNRIYELLTDFQKEGHDDKGGNGWMRTLTFRPSKKDILVKTFSVLGNETFIRCMNNVPENLPR